MPRWAKVILWIVVIGASAGAGAYVAAHTDPFPPGVDDPGARAPAPSDGASVDPPGDVPVERWRVELRSRSVHTFRVGGSCRSAWRGRVTFRVGADALRGVGTARLVSSSCDFPVAQPQAEEVTLSVAGARRADRLELRFGVTNVIPPGTDDLGGFVATISGGAFEVGAATSRDRARLETPDDRSGTSRSDTTIVATCVANCST